MCEFKVDVENNECERIVIVGSYESGMEKSKNGREAFWEMLNECQSEFREKNKIILLSNLNAKLGDKEREGVLWRYGVPKINENGERLLEVCTERRLIAEIQGRRILGRRGV